MGQVIKDNRIGKIATALGAQITRYGIVFLLLLFGTLKWTAAEAHGIQPLVAHSPLWSWLYGPLGLQGTSIFFGVFEVAAGIAIALRPFFPVVSAAGSAFCILMFLTTLSFLFTTPGLLMSSASGFILKDIVLLGGSIWTAGEALAAASLRESVPLGPEDGNFAPKSLG
jgi:reactive chlorine resistance protein C